ncbi:DUF3987 domain-containing protein [Methylobacterium sp. WL122]|nr:DUF3987 domain-containing protein [Methylobacterium sp. WL122]
MPAEAASTPTLTVELAGFRISNALFAAVFDAGPVETPDVFAQAVSELGQAQAREFARVLGQNDPAWRDALATDERPLTEERNATAEPPTWDWHNPDLSLLPDDHRSAIAFPVEIFGPFWAEWCRVSARNAGAPVNFTAGTLLATVGAMLGNVRWPMGSSTWKHPSVLWVALIGPPSAAKTPAMSPVEALVAQIYEQRRAAYLATAAERARDSLISGFVADDYARDLKKQALEHWRTQRSIPANLPVPPKEGEPLPDLVAPSLFFNNVTVEGIVAQVAGLPRGALLKSNELGAWFGTFDRYAGGRTGGDRFFWNEAFDGKTYEIARKGQDLRGILRSQTIIPHLSIGVLGGTHPTMIRSLLSRRGCEDDDGLAHRFLWIWGDSLDAEALDPHRDMTDADDGRALAALMTLDELPQNAGDKPEYVRATPDAEIALATFKAEIARASVGQAAWRRSSLGKAPGLALRISNVLAHLRWSADPVAPAPADIDLSVMRDAILFVRTYVIPNAERLQRIVASGDAEGDARALVALIQEHRWTRFHITDLKRQASQRLRDTRQRKDALEILIAAGLIAEDFQRDGDTKGRPREEYKVNPRVLASTAQPSPF